MNPAIKEKYFPARYNMEERIETYEEERVEIYAESNFDSADEAEEVSEGGKKDKEDNNGK